MEENKLTLEEMLALARLIDISDWGTGHFRMPLSVEGTIRQTVEVDITQNNNTETKAQEPYSLTVYSEIPGAQEVNAHILGKYGGSDERVIHLFNTVISYQQEVDQRVKINRRLLLKALLRKELGLKCESGSEDTSLQFNLDEMLKMASKSGEWHIYEDKETEKDYYSFPDFRVLDSSLGLPFVHITKLPSGSYRIRLEESSTEPLTRLFESPEISGSYEGTDLRLVQLYEQVDKNYTETRSKLLREGLEKARGLLQNDTLSSGQEAPKSERFK
jgi:hypothetical protein